MTSKILSLAEKNCIEKKGFFVLYTAFVWNTFSSIYCRHCSSITCSCSHKTGGCLNQYSTSKYNKAV